MTAVEMPSQETLELVGIECLLQLDELGWNRPPAVYGVFAEDDLLLSAQLPLPAPIKDVTFGQILFTLAEAINEMRPPYDRIASALVRDKVVAFMSYCEIMVNDKIGAVNAADLHTVKSSTMPGSHRYRVMLGVDITGRTYRAMQKHGDPGAFQILDGYAESGVVPLALNLLTLGIAKQTPWAKPEWIAAIQQLRVPTHDEFVATVKADLKDGGDGYLMARE